MNLEDTKKIINNVIENEFNHIQDTQEMEDLRNNTKINTKSENAEDALKRLIEVLPEHKELIDKFESEFAGYWIELCRYYFKKGVVSGTTNLKFLEMTKIMTYII